MKIKRNVVMLPANERALDADMVLNTDTGKLSCTLRLGIINIIPKNSIYQNLYITSDEEIKEGDWAYKHDVKGKIIKWVDTNNPWYKDARKIIATTDKSIAIQNDTVTIRSGKSRINTYPTEKTIIPSPSPAFVQAYIKAYNAGKPITEVMVEYDCDHSQMPDKIIDVLKVDSNNTITITKVKDSWTRDEVIAIARKAFEDSCKYSSFKEFIEDEL